MFLFAVLTTIQIHSIFSLDLFGIDATASEYLSDEYPVYQDIVLDCNYHAKYQERIKSITWKFNGYTFYQTILNTTSKNYYFIKFDEIEANIVEEGSGSNFRSGAKLGITFHNGSFMRNGGTFCCFIIFGTKDQMYWGNSDVVKKEYQCNNYSFIYDTKGVKQVDVIPEQQIQVRTTHTLYFTETSSNIGTEMDPIYSTFLLILCTNILIH